MSYQILSKIESPSDVKLLSDGEVKILCAEIRDLLISTVSENGGHLASNLGVVELTVALHRVFDSPHDSIIFDVGHQCYTHKLLTGRYNKFSTIRTEDGLSGFMRPDESIHDPFITGHSSTSISAAYGIYKAKQLCGDSGTAVAVVGDGALTGGMVYEALNNAGTARKNFIVVLNDNKMSISTNVGALAKYLNVFRSSRGYHRFKKLLLNTLSHTPLIGGFIRKYLMRSKLMLKTAIYNTNIFEGFGFHYLGPVDGHNEAEVEKILKIAGSKNCPVLVHVITTKGKGYNFAEQKPRSYHGVAPFNVDEGAKKGESNSFSDVFGATLSELAEKDKKICAITAAMTEGTGLAGFATSYHSRFFDVGIAEQHAVTFSAALASKGLKPYFAVYSSFLQRGFDQIIHDAAIANLPVVFCIDRAGFVGEDGETHHGLFDAAYLSQIPNLEVYSPSYFTELSDLLAISANEKKLTAIRYPRGSELIEDDGSIDFSGPFTFIGNSSKTVVVTYGRIFANALEAVNRLKAAGNDVSILKLNRISPISEGVFELLKECENIIFFEEGIRSGGIGQQFGSKLIEHGINCKYRLLAVDDIFVPGAPTNSLLKKYKFDVDSMISEIGGLC